MADQSNSGNDVGGQGVLAGQVFSDSDAVYKYNPNPVGDFQFSGREDVVTVKDIEEIVKSVRDCFEHFIEVQRSYLDRRSQTSNDSSSSEEGNDGSSTTSTSDSSGLTERTNFDIIKEELSKDITSSKEDILKSISDIHTDISTKIENTTVDISEKLIKNNEKEENSSYLDSVVDFMSSTAGDIKNAITDIFSSKDTTTSSTVENGNVEVLETPLKDNSALTQGDERNVEENGEIDGEKLIYQISENVEEQITEQKSSIVESLGSEIKSISDNIIDMSTGILSSITDGIANIAKDTTDMLLQNSSFQMMLNGTVEGITEPTKEIISETPITVEQEVSNAENVQSDNLFDILSGKNGVPNLEDIPESEFSDGKIDVLKTEVTKEDNSSNIISSFFSDLKDSIFNLFSSDKKTEASDEDVVNGQTNTAVTNLLDEQNVVAPTVGNKQNESDEIASDTTEEGSNSDISDTVDSSMNMVLEGIKGNREYNGERFDKLEEMLKQEIERKAPVVKRMTIPDMSEHFETERIH